MKRHLSLVPLKHSQHGAAAVEFGLVAIVFLILLIGVVEMGRVLFTWNAAVEATRFGARVAVVCNIDIPNEPVLAQMQKFLPNLTAGNLSVSYLPDGCSISNCKDVRVELSGLSVQTYIPIVGAALTVPPFSTTLPRESLMSDIDDRLNPLCI